MLNIIKELLKKIIDNIDSGNSNLSEEDSIEIIKVIKSYTDKTERLSKYQSCQYLNISRASFDNYIKAGYLPKGKKQAGFKELSWSKKDLDTLKSMFKEKYKYKNSNVCIDT